VLVRRLVAGGVSLGAAMSYAHLLSPRTAAAAPPADSCDEYPLVDVRMITDGNLTTMLSRGYILVRVQTDQEVRLNLSALIRRGGELTVIGSLSPSFQSSGSRYHRVPISPEGRAALSGLTKVIVMLAAQGTFNQFPPVCPVFPAVDARLLQN
jgi:hypothetical protein